MMITKKRLRVLLVESSSSDVQVLTDAFSKIAGTDCTIVHAELLEEALSRVVEETFDVVLLDLDLPDCRGVETFLRLHGQAPTVPVLVLTSADDESTGMQAIQKGAQDYLVKNEVHAQLLGRSVRYAIDRAELQRALSEERQRARQEHEFTGIDRLSGGTATAVTAQIYSGNTLRESAPTEFEGLIDRYMKALDMALEHRIFKENAQYSDALRQVGEELGILRASARDVVEIHSAALKRKVENVPWQKAQAYLEEGRLTGLELMGYLAGFYRHFYPGRIRREVQV